jgi:hypothetical protein
MVLDGSRTRGVVEMCLGRRFACRRCGTTAAAEQTSVLDCYANLNLAYDALVASVRQERAQLSKRR